MIAKCRRTGWHSVAASALHKITSKKQRSRARSGQLQPLITAGRDFPPEKPACHSCPSTAIIPLRPAVETTSAIGAYEPILQPGSHAPTTCALVAVGSPQTD